MCFCQPKTIRSAPVLCHIKHNSTCQVQSAVLWQAWLLGIAEIEREHIRERQTAEIAAAKQRGVYTGRKQGATKAPTGPEQAQALRARGLKNREF